MYYYIFIMLIYLSTNYLASILRTANVPSSYFSWAGFPRTEIPCSTRSLPLTCGPMCRGAHVSAAVTACARELRPIPTAMLSGLALSSLPRHTSET